MQVIIDVFSHTLQIKEFHLLLHHFFFWAANMQIGRMWQDFHSLNQLPLNTNTQADTHQHLSGKSSGFSRGYVRFKLFSFNYGT